jgi:prepilin peptidase CpaA
LSTGTVTPQRAAAYVCSRMASLLFGSNGAGDQSSLIGPLDLLLLGVLAVAVATDLRQRRISNRLTYPAMAIGLAANAWAGGWNGVSTSIAGWLLGAGLLLLPFGLRAMGAGDVKLMATIGAFKGPQFVLMAALYASLAGGLLALLYLVKERRLKATLCSLAGGWIGGLGGSGAKAGAIPYAPAIAIGAMIALLPLAKLAS